MKKPHITLLWSGRGIAPPMWRCAQPDPNKPWVINVGDGKTPKEAYHYCVNATKHLRFVG